MFVYHGCDINRVSAMTGKAPLHLAVESANIKIIELIINTPGANLNIRTRKARIHDNDRKTVAGMTALHSAACSNQLDNSVLALLIHRGANAGIANSEGQTPLMSAVKNNFYDRVKMILASNHNVNHIDHQTNTALTLAVEEADTEILAVLLASTDLRYSTIDHKKLNGESALFIAVKRADIDKLKLLLAVPGIDLEARRLPGDGKTLLELAQDRNHIQMIQMIQEKLDEEEQRDFRAYCKTLRKTPSDALFQEYKNDKHTARSTEKEYVEGRKTCVDAFSDMYRFNSNYVIEHKIKEKVLARIQSLGHSGNIEKLYQACINYVKYHSVIVLTINLTFLPQGLENHQALNILERDTKGSDYIQKRNTTEQGQFQFISSHINRKMFSNIHARPNYALLALLNEKHEINAATYYGQSYLILDEVVKFNCLYNAADSLNVRINDGKDLIACTYHHLEILLFQSSDMFLRALLQAVTTGHLPPHHPSGSYTEILLPRLDLLDPNITKFIYISPNEYQLTVNEKSQIKSLGIAVNNSKDNPYPMIRDEFMKCIASNQTIRAQELLQSHPYLIHLTNNQGYEPLTIAVDRTYTDLVKILIKYPIDLNRLSIAGKTILHHAIEGGDYQLIKLIANKPGIDFNMADSNDIKALDLATTLYGADSRIVSLLNKKENQAKTEKAEQLAINKETKRHRDESYSTEEIIITIFSMGMYAYLKNCIGLKSNLSSAANVAKIALAVLAPPAAMLTGIFSLFYSSNETHSEEEIIVANEGIYKK